MFYGAIKCVYKTLTIMTYTSILVTFISYNFQVTEAYYDMLLDRMAVLVCITSVCKMIDVILIFIRLKNNYLFDTQKNIGQTTLNNHHRPHHQVQTDI